MRKIANLALITGFCLTLAGCGPKATQDVENDNNAAVMNAVRNYGLTSVKPTTANASATPQAVVSADMPGDSDAYLSRINAYFQQRDFDALEREAAEARTSKERFSGGSWKINNFYAGVVSIRGKSQEANEGDLNASLKVPKDWAAAKPESAAARIALANCYIAVGWKLRGSGYANTVDSGAWKAFHRQIALARNVLIEAAGLKERCPYWYVAMQNVALAEGWDRKNVRELFDQAAVFEQFLLLLSGLRELSRT